MTLVCESSLDIVKDSFKLPCRRRNGSKVPRSRAAWVSVDICKPICIYLREQTRIFTNSPAKQLAYFFSFKLKPYWTEPRQTQHHFTEQTAVCGWAFQFISKQNETHEPNWLALPGIKRSFWIHNQSKHECWILYLAAVDSFTNPPC